MKTNNTHSFMPSLSFSYFSNIEEYIESLYGWDLEFSQLNKGSGYLTSSTVVDANFNCMRFFQSKRGEAKGIAVNPGLTFFLGENIANNIIMMRKDVSTDTLLCLPQGSEIFTITPDRYIGYTFNISLAALKQGAQNLSSNLSTIELPTSRKMFQLPNYYAELLRIGLRSLYQITKNRFKAPQLMHLATNDIIENLITPILVNILTSNIDSITIATESKSKLNELLHIINDNLDSPPTMQELASKINLTPRRIQYIFKNNIGISPQAYIKAKRLNSVRRNLSVTNIKRGDAKEISQNLGFWNMSQFAKEYKEHFNFSPKDTPTK